MSHLRVDIQRVTATSGLPADDEIRRWAGASLADDSSDVQLTIRLVDTAESAGLNAAYRNKQGPTNVLSFPFEPPPGVDSDLLGDLVICAPLVAREAEEQGKTERAHWAHMVIHGILHLRGYDHQTDEQAGIMESRETAILAGLGFDDPYR